MPVEREAFLKTPQRDGRRDVATRDSLHDIRGEVGEFEQMGDVALGNPLALPKMRELQDED